MLLAQPGSELFQRCRGARAVDSEQNRRRTADRELDTRIPVKKDGAQSAVNALLASSDDIGASSHRVNISPLNDVTTGWLPADSSTTPKGNCWRAGAVAANCTDGWIPLRLLMFLVGESTVARELLLIGRLSPADAPPGVGLFGVRASATVFIVVMSNARTCDCGIAAVIVMPPVIVPCSVPLLPCMDAVFVAVALGFTPATTATGAAAAAGRPGLPALPALPYAPRGLAVGGDGVVASIGLPANVITGAGTTAAVGAEGRRPPLRARGELTASVNVVRGNLRGNVLRGTARAICCVCTWDCATGALANSERSCGLAVASLPAVRVPAGDASWAAGSVLPGVFSSRNDDFGCAGTFAKSVPSTSLASRVRVSVSPRTTARPSRVALPYPAPSCARHEQRLARGRLACRGFARARRQGCSPGQVPQSYFVNSRTRGGQDIFPARAAIWRSRYSRYARLCRPAPFASRHRVFPQRCAVLVRGNKGGHRRPCREAEMQEQHTTSSATDANPPASTGQRQQRARGRGRGVSRARTRAARSTAGISSGSRCRSSTSRRSSASCPAQWGQSCRCAATSWRSGSGRLPSR